MIGALIAKKKVTPSIMFQGVDPNIVEEKLKADTEHRIKSVNVVHNETSTGVTSRIAEIREAIDRAGHPVITSYSIHYTKLYEPPMKGSMRSRSSYLP